MSIPRSTLAAAAAKPTAPSIALAICSRPSLQLGGDGLARKRPGPARSKPWARAVERAFARHNPLVCGHRVPDPENVDTRAKNGPTASVPTTCRVPNPANRLNVVQRPKTLFEPQRLMTSRGSEPRDADRKRSHQRLSRSDRSSARMSAALTFTVRLPGDGGIPGL